MAGLSNTTKQQPTQRASALTNPMLREIEIGIEAAVPPALVGQYQALVAAGKKIMLDPKTAEYIEQRLKASPGMATDLLSNGVADLTALAYNEVGKHMSDADRQLLTSIACGFASFTLMAQALDRAKATGKIKLRKKLIDDCALATAAACMARFGFTESGVAQVFAAGRLGLQGSRFVQ